MGKTAAASILLIILTAVVHPQTNRGSWLQGSWQGTGYQMDNDSTWTMKLSARGRRFKIDYPSLNCGGRWKLLSIDSRRARFIENITFGQAECVNKGTVLVERLSRRQVAYRFYYRGARDVSASAILNRK